MEDDIIELATIPAPQGDVVHITALPRTISATESVTLNVNDERTLADGIPYNMTNNATWYYSRYYGATRSCGDGDTSRSISPSGNLVYTPVTEDVCSEIPVTVDGVTKIFLLPPTTHEDYPQLKSEFDKITWSKEALEEAETNEYVSVNKGFREGLTIALNSILWNSRLVGYQRKISLQDIKNFAKAGAYSNARIIREIKQNVESDRLSVETRRREVNMYRDRVDMKDSVFSKLTYDEIEAFNLVGSLSEYGQSEINLASEEERLAGVEARLAALKPVRKKKGEQQQIVDNVNNLYGTIIDGVSYDPLDKILYILFKNPVSITYRGTTIDFGRPKIHMRFGQRNGSCIRTVNAFSRDRSRFIHPHISNNNFCLGTYEPHLNEKAKRGDMAGIIVMLWDYIQRYNDESPLNSWAGCVDSMRTATSLGRVDYNG